MSTGTEDRAKAEKIAREKTACFSALGGVRTLTAQLEKAKDEQGVLEAKTNPSLTLFRLVDAFVSCDVVRRKKNSPETIASWRSFTNQLIEKFGGETEMRQITREMAEAFMREYEGTVSAAQFNHVLQFYKRAWKVLGQFDSPSELKARLHSDSPWRFVLPMKVTSVVGRRPFTQEQLTRIWRVLDEIGDKDLTLLFDLARNTGARLHDLVSWKWEENVKFSHEGQGLEVVMEWKPHKTKNSTGKIISIPILDERVASELYRRFNSRPVGEEWVLPRMMEIYEHSHGVKMSAMCQEVFKKAGIETMKKVDGNARKNCVYGIHSFRHTLVSELFQSGVDLGTIQHLYTGHGSAFVTELYAHANMDKKRLDLSHLKKIEVAERTREWAVDLPKNDRAFLDEIELMDANTSVKVYAKGLVQFKTKADLEVILKIVKKRLASV